MSTAVIGAPEFRARSGRRVRSNEDGSVTFEGVRGYLGPEQVFDAAEFFQAQRDIELGRWRDPLNPDYVVSQWGDDPEEIRVVHEPTARHEDFTREKAFVSDWIPSSVAHRYFEAHPERKPWLGAKPGEVWLVTWRGREAAYTADVRDFNGAYAHGEYQTFRHADPEITAARRMWPEDAS